MFTMKSLATAPSAPLATCWGAPESAKGPEQVPEPPSPLEEAAVQVTVTAETGTVLHPVNVDAPA